MLRDLRRDQKDGLAPFRGVEHTSNWLASAANDLQKRIINLAKQKAELTSLEENAETATLNRTEEVLRLWRILFHEYINTHRLLVKVMITHLQ